MSVNVSILITTRNRIEDLKITLQSLESLLDSSKVECLIYDDASVDGTYEFLEKYYPKIKRFKNEKPLGLIHNRNVLLNNCIGKYAISLDDDANFLSENVLENIEKHFVNNSNCGVLACRIFWGKEKPLTSNTNHKLERSERFCGMWTRLEYESLERDSQLSLNGLFFMERRSLPATTCLRKIGKYITFLIYWYTTVWITKVEKIIKITLSVKEEAFEQDGTCILCFTLGG